MNFKYTLLLFLETVPWRYSTTLPNKLGNYMCFDAICCIALITFSIIH